MRPLLVVMLLALACERSSTPAPATPVVVAPGQPRRVDIRVSNQGYTPAPSNAGFNPVQPPPSNPGSVARRQPGPTAGRPESVQLADRVRSAARPRRRTTLHG